MEGGGEVTGIEERGHWNWGCGSTVIGRRGHWNWGGGVNGTRGSGTLEREGWER